VGPLSAVRGPSRPARGAGFTLVEVMVVIVVIGICATLAVVNLGGDSVRDLEREAKRLAGTLEHAQALAQWQSETLGVSMEGGGYRFWRRDSTDQWTALTGDDVLAPRALAAGMRVAPMTYAGAPVAPDAILPFRPTGRNEPYALALASSAGNVVVTGDPLGRVTYAVAAADAPVPQR
jgi:general secretion pathway protein H